jgi:hypothetical protein
MAARAPGHPSGSWSRGASDGQPGGRDVAADAYRLSPETPGPCSERADARSIHSSRRGDETGAFRPLRVTTEDCVRYLAGVAVSAIPHTHPHVRVGTPSAPRGPFHVVGVVAGSHILVPLVGLSLNRRGRMSPWARIDGRSPASSCGSAARAALQGSSHLAAPSCLSLSMLGRQTYELIMRFTVRARVANNACRASGRAAPDQRARWRGSQPSLGRVVADRGAPQGRTNEGRAAMRGFQSEQPVRADGGASP